MDICRRFKVNSIKNSNELFTSKRFHRDSPVGMMKIPTVLAMGHPGVWRCSFSGGESKDASKMVL